MPNGEDLVETLRTRSEERRKNDPEFQKQISALERFQARKARHEISLNEETYRAEMAAEERDAEHAKVDKDDEPRKRHTERDVWKSGPYNDEVIHILADYVSLGGDILTAGPVPAGEAARQPLRP